MPTDEIRITKLLRANPDIEAAKLPALTLSPMHRAPRLLDENPEELTWERGQLLLRWWRSVVRRRPDAEAVPSRQGGEVQLRLQVCWRPDSVRW